MTIDLIGIMEQMFQSTWFAVLATLTAISCVWYYVRHSAQTMQNPQARQPGMLFKNFLAGQPFALLIILIIVIAVAALVVQFLDIRLAM